MTNDEYHAHPAFGSTAINCFLRSRREFEGRYVTRTIKPEESDNFDFGTALHYATLEPDLLFDLAVEIPPEALTSNGHRRGKAWEQFKEENNGKLILKSADWAQLRGMLDAIRENPLVAELLRLEGRREYPLFWRHASGVECKCKPDILTGSRIIDVKTTVDASPEAFTRAILRCGYHRQAAHYRDGVYHLCGELLPFLFVAIQKTPPYTCRVYRLGEEELQLGADDVNEGLHLLAQCYETGDWREPGEHEERTLFFPGWMMRGRGDLIESSDVPTETDSEWADSLWQVDAETLGSET